MGNVFRASAVFLSSLDAARFLRLPMGKGVTMFPLPLWLIVVLVAIIFTCGCATNVPVCEKFEAAVVKDSSGTSYVMLDMDNINKLIAMMNGLSQGKCRLPPS